MPAPTSSPIESLFFLDTNIFIYALLASEPLKKQRALQLLEQALASHSGCISYQVIQEFANVAAKILPAFHRGRMQTVHRCRHATAEPRGLQPGADQHRAELASRHRLQLLRQPDPGGCTASRGYDFVYRRPAAQPAHRGYLAHR